MENEEVKKLYIIGNNNENIEKFNKQLNYFLDINNDYRENLRKYNIDDMITYKHKFDEKIKDLESQLSEKENKFHELKTQLLNDFQNELEYKDKMNNNIKEQLLQDFENDRKTYHEQINKLNNEKLNIIDSERKTYEEKIKRTEELLEEKDIIINNIRNDEREFYENKMNNNKQRNDEDIDYYKNTITKYDEKYEELLSQFNDFKSYFDQKNKKKIAHLGKEGEMTINNLLNRFYEYDPNVNFECSASRRREGDFKIIYYNYTGIIDSKNYSTNINEKEINKLKRDVDHSLFDFGIICSLKQNIGFTHNMKNFDILFTNNDKPILLLSELNDNPKYLFYGMKLLKYILNLSNDKNLILIQDIIKNDINNFNKIEKFNKNILKNVQDIGTIINDSLLNLNNIIKKLNSNNLEPIEDVLEEEIKDIVSENQLEQIKEIKIHNNLYICNTCSYETNKKTSWNQHIKTKKHMKYN